MIIIELRFYNPYNREKYGFKVPTEISYVHIIFLLFSCPYFSLNTSLHTRISSSIIKDLCQMAPYIFFKSFFEKHIHIFSVILHSQQKHAGDAICETISAGSAWERGLTNWLMALCVCCESARNKLRFQISCPFTQLQCASLIYWAQRQLSHTCTAAAATQRRCLSFGFH